MSNKTIKHEGDPVIYEVALCNHPLVVGEDDDRSDDDLIGNVEERTEVDGMEFPDWAVFESDPPDAETLRYVDTKSRINVRATFGEVYGGHKKKRDVFDEIMDRVTIDGFDDPQMSHWGATHQDDFDGDVHLDLTGDSDE